MGVRVISVPAKVSTWGSICRRTSYRPLRDVATDPTPSPAPWFNFRSCRPPVRRGVCDHCPRLYRVVPRRNWHASLAAPSFIRDIVNDARTFRQSAFSSSSIEAQAFITFRVRRSRGEMYTGHGRLCVCVWLSVCPSPHCHTTARPRM